MLTTWTKSRLLLGALLLLVAGVSAPAQVVQGRTIRTPRVRTEQSRIEKFHGEVLQMTRVSITVRDREDLNLVRTFTFDEKLAPQMATLIDRDRPFQHGDKIEVRFRGGTDTAVAIKGKPSKPRRGLR